MVYLIPRAHSEKCVIYNTVLKKNRERIWEEIKKKGKKGEWTGNMEIRTTKKFLRVGKACSDMFRPSPRFIGRTFVSSGFSADDTLISASTVPHCGSKQPGAIKGALSLARSACQLFILRLTLPGM